MNPQLFFQGRAHGMKRPLDKVQVPGTSKQNEQTENPVRCYLIHVLSAVLEGGGVGCVTHTPHFQIKPFFL